MSIIQKPASIKLAAEPHIRAAKIEELCRLQPDIDIISPICRWLESNRTEDGTSQTLRSRQQYQLETIP